MTPYVFFDGPHVHDLGFTFCASMAALCTWRAASEAAAYWTGHSAASVLEIRLLTLGAVGFALAAAMW